MDRTWFVCGSALAFFSTAFGAFGAHSLRGRLTADALAVFETGVRYQMYHALALFAVAYAAQRWGGSFVTASGWLFVAGIVLFSGSLYVLSITGIRVLGAVTPFGGVCFLGGWACLVVAAWRAG